MQASAVIGRVGILAVALGVGLVVGGTGVAGASPSDSSGSSTESGTASTTESRSGASSASSRSRGPQAPQTASETAVAPSSARAAARAFDGTLRANAGNSNKNFDPNPFGASDALSLVPSVGGTASKGRVRLPLATSGSARAVGWTDSSESRVYAAAQAEYASGNVAAAQPAASGAVVEAVSYSTRTTDPLVPAGTALAWTVAAAARREIERAGESTTIAAVVTSGQTAGASAAQVANEPPVVSEVALSTPTANTGALTGTVKASDPNGDKMAYTATASVKGTVTITKAGVFTYTPTAAARHAAARIGATEADKTDTVTVTVTDSKGAATTKAVGVMISPQNRAPIEVKATVGIPNASTGVVTGRVTAKDPDKDPLTFSAPASTSKGDITIDATTGTFTYTATSDARATAARTGAIADRGDSFTVTITDGYGGTATVQVTVAVAPRANISPQAGTPTLSVDTGTGVVTGTVNATDPDGDVVSYAAGASTSSKGGNVSVTADGGFTYTPTPSIRHDAAKNSTTDTFSVSASDGFGGLSKIIVKVTVVPQNSVPVAGAQTVPWPNINTGVVTGTAVATDPDGDTLTYSGPNATTNGKVTVNPNGRFVYTPTSTARSQATVSTTDSFTVTAADGYGGTVAIPITVTILPFPTVTVGIPNQDTGIVSGSVAAPNADAGPFTFSVQAVSAKGSATIDASTGIFTYIPTATTRHEAAANNAKAADKQDSFAVTISDAQGIPKYATSVTVPIRPQNSAPTGSAIVGALDPLTGVINGTVLGTDLDGDKLSYSGSQLLSEGSVTVDANTGSFTYRPISRVDAVTSVIRGLVNPTELILNPDGSRAFITDPATNSLSVLDTATKTIVAVIGGLTKPAALAITPDGKRIYVVERNSVAILDISSSVVTGRVSNLYAPDGSLPTPTSVAVSPDGTLAYVVNSSGALSIVDTATNTRVQTVFISSSPKSAVFFSPDGQRAYITGNSLQAINTATNQIVQSNLVSANSLVFSRDGSRSFGASNSSSSGKTVGAVSVRLVEGKSAGGRSEIGIYSLALSPAGDLLYGLGVGGQVSIFDTTSMTYLGTAKFRCDNCSIGATSQIPGPKSIVASPDGTAVYAVNPANGTVVVLTKWAGPTTETFNVTITESYGGKATVPVTVSFVG